MKAFSTGDIVGSYRLIRSIGKGNYGEVFLAQAISDQHEMAVKILAPVDDKDYRDFIQEVSVAMRLKHPNILSVEDFGLEDDHPFLVMPYIDHGNLRQRYPKRTQLSWDTLVPYVKQLASALHCVHKQGLVHRDVKPENILIQANGELLLSDFGIIILSHTVSPDRTQKPIGTAYYMAPEQIQGQAVRESDQYALAVMIYELLTGRPTFNGSNVPSILYQHIHNEPVPLRDKVPSLSPEIERIIMKMLAKDPKDRFKSMSDFLAELDSLRTGSVPNESTFFTEHTGPIYIVAYANNLRYVASAGQDSTVCVWEAASGKSIRTYYGHVGEIWSLTWSPDSRYIASASADETVQVWEATTGNPLPTYEDKGLYNEHQGAVYAVAWSPDNLSIASAGEDHAVYIWDAKTGKTHQNNRLHSKSVSALAWSPDSKFLASAGHDTHIYVWDVHHRELFRTLDKHTDHVTSLAWSPTGEYLASASHDNTVIIWNLSSGERVSTYKAHTKGVTSVSWSSDRIHLASGSWDTSVHVWRMDDLEPRVVVPNGESWVNTVTWSPDGKRVAFGGLDGIVQLFSPF